MNPTYLRLGIGVVAWALLMIGATEIGLYVAPSHSHSLAEDIGSYIAIFGSIAMSFFIARALVPLRPDERTAKISESADELSPADLPKAKLPPPRVAKSVEPPIDDVIEQESPALVSAIVATLELCSDVKFTGLGHRFRGPDGPPLLVLVSKDYGGLTFKFDIHWAHLEFLRQSPYSLVAFGFITKKLFLTIPSKALFDEIANLPPRKHPTTGENVWQLQFVPAPKSKAIHPYLPSLIPFENIPMMSLNAMQSIEHVSPDYIDPHTGNQL